MTFEFSNWTLRIKSEDLPTQQYDNLTIPINIVGDNIPSGTWKLFLAYQENLDVILLTKDSTGLHTLLTAEQLPFEGVYKLQIQLTNADEIKHSTIAGMTVRKSLSGDEHWVVIPTEFTQFEQEFLAKADLAIEKYPYINETNKHWMVWNVESRQFVDTGISAEGSMELFIAQYEVTPFKDMRDAKKAGKEVILMRGGFLGYQTLFWYKLSFFGPSQALFNAVLAEGSLSNPNSVTVELILADDSDRWFSGSFELQKKIDVENERLIYKDSVGYMNGLSIGDGLVIADGSLKVKQNMFVAEYGVTTFQEVVSAFNAGKKIFMQRTMSSETVFYELHSLTSSSAAFSRASGSANQLQNAQLKSDNTWSNTSHRIIFNINGKTSSDGTLNLALTDIVQIGNGLKLENGVLSLA